MLRVIGCITQQHDLRLVVLAAFICVLTCGTTVNLMAGAQTKKGATSLAHVLAASAVFGSGVWSLHFVAMLAFISGTPIAYDISLTFISVLIAIVGSMFALSVWLFSPSRSIGIVVGGILLGVSISAMHFCGVLAMRVSGTLHFDKSEAISAIAFCLIFSTLALARSEALSTHRRQMEVTTWLALAVIGIHFIAMTGLSFEPSLVNTHESAVLGSSGLAIAVGSVSIAILIVSLAATLMEQHLAQRTALEIKQLQRLSDISEEVLIISQDGITVQANVAAGRMFGVPEHQLIGGRTLDLIAEVDRHMIRTPPEHLNADLNRQEIHLHAANGTIVPVGLSIKKIEYNAKPAIIIALRDLSDRKRDEARMRHLANYDTLTNLPNRRLLSERLAVAIETATRSGNGLALLSLDLSRFNQVNDRFGHPAGDALLLLVAKRLQSEIRFGDTLARMGSDEFVIVAPFERREHIEKLARQIIEALTKPFSLDVGQCEIGVSIGISFCPEDSTCPNELMRVADVALDRAQEQEQSSFRIFEHDMDARLKNRQQLERDLRYAIERGQLLMHYQPLVNGSTGDVEGFEALIRWNHPERGMIPPFDFIPLAEEIGLISKIGQWALETACTAAATWEEPLWVAVNVSPVQFQNSELPTLIAETLARAGLACNRLEIEITEGVLMAEPIKSAQILLALRALGVRLTLDDFGTGYSSLSYLHEFRFDKIKIDRSFLMRLGKADDALILVRSIIGLAHNLGLTIVAEGVETTDQLKTLRDLKCDYLQGYLTGRPMPMDALIELTAARARMLVLGASSIEYPNILEERQRKAAAAGTTTQA
jgi:diguanylate cyclase (GGDEF)-like protein/PAS domain S-box-containing protein